MSQTFVDLRQVKQQVHISQVLDYWGVLPAFRTNGDALVGPSPLRAGAGPRSFKVTVSKNAWYDFGMKEGGNVLDLVAKKEKTTVADAAVKLVEWFGLTVAAHTPKNKQQPTPAELEKTPTTNEPLEFQLQNLDPAHAWLSAHGIPASVAQSFGAGYCPKGILAGRIAVPIRNKEGIIVAYAGRSVGAAGEEETWKFPRGFRPELELFNYVQAEQDARLPVGLSVFFDPLTAIAEYEGSPTAVVSLLGDAMSVEQQHLIEHLCWCNCENITIGYGAPDAARQAVAIRLMPTHFVHLLQPSRPL